MARVARCAPGSAAIPRESEPFDLSPAEIAAVLGDEDEPAGSDTDAHDAFASDAEAPTIPPTRTCARRP